MKSIINYLASGLVALALLVGLSTTAATVLNTGSVSAASPKQEVQDGIDAIGGRGEGRGAGAFTNLLESIINILLFIIGAIAVIMIIIGGIKYTTSNGDQSAVTSAKNTILYAVVGLIVAIMAYAIVNFIVRQL